MTEIIFMCIGIFFFALTVGFVLGGTLSDVNRERAEVKVVENEAEDKEAERSRPFPAVEGGKDPMMLRNGYNVTRDKDPTFAEQFVNILNYNGESQTEGDYEESGNYAAEDMG